MRVYKEKSSRGNYWSTEKLLLSGEILDREVDSNRILSREPLPMLGDDDGIANKVKECMNSGYIGFMVEVGYGQGRSMYLI